MGEAPGAAAIPSPVSGRPAQPAVLAQPSPVERARCNGRKQGCRRCLADRSAAAPVGCTPYASQCSAVQAIMASWRHGMQQHTAPWSFHTPSIMAIWAHLGYHGHRHPAATNRPAATHVGRVSCLRASCLQASSAQSMTDSSWRAYVLLPSSSKLGRLATSASCAPMYRLLYRRQYVSRTLRAGWKSPCST